MKDFEIHYWFLNANNDIIDATFKLKCENQLIAINRFIAKMHHQRKLFQITSIIEVPIPPTF